MMWDFDFGKAVAMVLKTLPFVVLRLIVLNSRESKSSAVSWDYVVQVRTRLS